MKAFKYRLRLPNIEKISPVDVGWTSASECKGASAIPISRGLFGYATIARISPLSKRL